MMMNTQNSYQTIMDSKRITKTIKSSGDIHFSTKQINMNIENYEICILLDDADRFLGIESIRVTKNFYDPRRLTSGLGRSAEEIVDEFFNDIEE